MRRVFRKINYLNKNRKQLGELVLVVGAIYTYLLYNSIVRVYKDGQKTTT